MYHSIYSRRRNEEINRVELPNYVRQIKDPQDTYISKGIGKFRMFFYILVVVISGASLISLNTSNKEGLAQLFNTAQSAYELKTSATFSYTSDTNESFGPFASNEVFTTVTEDSDPPPPPDPKQTSTPPKPNQTSCSDGTPQKQCSNKKPLFCKDGELKDRCSSCGCPSHLTCDSDSERCIEQNESRSGVVSASYEGRVQIFVYKSDRDKKLFKKTTHTAELHVTIAEMNNEVEPGIHRVILEVPGFDLITIQGVSFPLSSFDSKWPEFMRRAYR